MTESTQSLFDEYGLDESNGYTKVGESADALNAASAAALTDDFPDIRDVPETYVELPVGIYIEDELVTYAEVKELNGRDEEEIAKSQRANGLRFLQAVVRQGLVRLGDHEVSGDKNLIKRLSLADRDTVLLAISKATFGDELEYQNYPCPECKELMDVNYAIDEIPVKKVDTPGKNKFEVDLRKGKAVLRLPNVADEEKAFNNLASTTDKERDTIFLTNCVLSLVDGKTGVVLNVNGNKEHILNLGVKDRATILTKMNSLAPGPQLSGVKVDHECGAEVTLPLTPDHLFPGL